MLKNRGFKIGLTILLALVIANVFTPNKLVSAGNVAYQFEPDPNYSQSDIMAVFKVFSYERGIQIEWNMPDGSGAYCHPVGGSGCVTKIQYGSTGPISASGEFFISGQGRPAGVYTAIATYCSLFAPGTNVCAWRDELVRANFTIDLYTISGNAGVADATLNYFDVTTRTAAADGNGKYTIMIPASWSGTVTPSKTGFAFSPASMTYTNLLENKADQNYTADETYSIFLPFLTKKE